MSELRRIEEKIYNDELIESLLEHLGCWGISTEQSGRLYTAGLPDGENNRSVQIKNNERLNSTIRSRGINGSIYDIVSYIVYEAETKEEFDNNLNKSKFWICNKLGFYEFIDDFYKQTSDKIQEKPKYNKWLSALNKKNNILELKNEKIELNLFKKENIIPYYKWYLEGMSTSVQKYFQISVDVQSERIIFPIHDSEGNLIGVKGRYFGNNQEIENKYKYIYTYPCNKSLELFNFHRALKHIKERKEVYIVEGAKTTMFLTQWNYPNCVSMEGDMLSPYQIKLLKELGMDINYIFAFDKDKNAAYVKKEADKLIGRLKYGIIDISGELEDKDSPCDKGKDVWEKLLNENKYKI